MEPGAVLLFENLRFWPGEEAASKRFAEMLARWGDVFVDDAFSVAHRRAASTTVLPRLAPSYLGLLFERELRELDALMHRPVRPLVAIFGGAKTETKLPLLERFSHFADTLVVGGALANTILTARHVQVGSSKVDTTALAHLKSFARSKKFFLPRYAVVSRAPDGKGARIIPLEDIGAGEAIWDIGPKTSRELGIVINRAKTIVWNGPLGLIEVPSFRRGTITLARDLLNCHAKVILGGGDTVAFLEQQHILSRFKYVSTGGGAMLAYLGGEKLPGLEALQHPQKI